MIRFYAFCLLVLCQFTSFSQRRCLTTEYAAKMGSLSSARPAQASRIYRDTLPDELVTIPVVVHVLYHASSQNITEAQIRSQIDVLNRDFGHMNADTANTPAAFRGRSANCRINFCLARIDPQGFLTSGIIRKYTSLEYFQGDDGMKFSAAGGDDAWDSERYLNIWVCNMFGRSLGYATPPGGPAATDGVVINFDVFGSVGFLRPPFNKGRTATHEIGHWMGLTHIWGDALCGDDGVDDTPQQKSYNYGCPSFPKTSNCSVDGNGDMFMNFMDFSDDACMNLFTTGQKYKMRKHFALHEYRNGFLDSKLCDSSYATSGGPVPSPEPGPVSEPFVKYMMVYPSPAQSQIRLQGVGNMDISGMAFDIVNMYGQRVMHIVCPTNYETVNISKLPSGVYQIKGASDKNGKVLRFVKL